MLLINNQEVEKLFTMKACLEALEDGLRRSAQRRRGVSAALGSVDALRAAGRLLALGHDGRSEPQDRRVRDSHEIRCGLLAQRRDGRKILHAAGHLVRFGHGLQRAQRRAAGDHQRRVASSICASAAAPVWARSIFAREDACDVGIFGSGGMARSYLEAFYEVRKLRRVRVYSPTQANREKFAREMTGKLDIEVRRRRHSGKGRARSRYRRDLHGFDTNGLR